MLVLGSLHANNLHRCFTVSIYPQNAFTDELDFSKKVNEQFLINTRYAENGTKSRQINQLSCSIMQYLM